MAMFSECIIPPFYCVPDVFHQPFRSVHASVFHTLIFLMTTAVSHEEGFKLMKLQITFYGVRFSIWDLNVMVDRLSEGFLQRDAGSKRIRNGQKFGVIQIRKKSEISSIKARFSVVFLRWCLYRFEFPCICVFVTWYFHLIFIHLSSYTVHLYNLSIFFLCFPRCFF